MGWRSVGVGNTLGVCIGTDVFWYTVVHSGFANDVGVTDDENSGVMEPAGSGDTVGL